VLWVTIITPAKIKAVREEKRHEKFVYSV